MRTLVLDIGNTATKAGCFADGRLRETHADLTPAEARALLKGWQPRHLLLASVAGRGLCSRLTFKEKFPAKSSS